MNNPLTLFVTPWFVSAFVGWVTAQVIKMTVAVFRGRKLDFRYLISTGGMPSAHSATVSALFASVGLTEGFDQPITMVAMTFAIITMFDATSVRRAAGNQARVLNIMIQELFRDHKLNHTRLKELLGHTRTEVFAGMTLVLLLGCIVVWLFDIN
jgi:acid phosphatase family membrane protein YuiD